MFARELLESITESVAAPLAVIGTVVILVAKTLDYYAHADERRKHQAMIEKIREQQAKLKETPTPKPATQTHVVTTKALPPIAPGTVQDSNSSPYSRSNACYQGFSFSYNRPTNQLNRELKVKKINAELAKRAKILEIQANARKLRQG